MSSEKREQLAGVETVVTNGGPAFPVYPRIQINQTRELNGMSLRDYFAAKAISVAANFEEKSPTYYHGPTKQPTYQGVAERAYLIADAMIKALDAK